MLDFRMIGERGRTAKDKNAPCFDGRALAILLAIVLLLSIGIWFAHTHLETNNATSTQHFEPKATPTR